MTAQIEDRYRYRGTDYSLVAISGPVEFNPEEYGVKPLGVCSACWRGYWCEYNVTDDGLYLQNLYINADNEKYPAINGVNVSEIEYQDVTEVTCEDGKWVEKPAKAKKYMGHREYKNINIPISFTGKVLLGAGFLRDYYVHMGFQNSWAYKKLVEFEFNKGKLICETDHSEMAEKIREKLDATGKELGDFYEGDIPKYVDDCFSLDYSTKAWWL